MGRVWGVCSVVVYGACVVVYVVVYLGVHMGRVWGVKQVY